MDVAHSRSDESLHNLEFSFSKKKTARLLSKPSGGAAVFASSKSEVSRRAKSQRRPAAFASVTMTNVPSTQNSSE